MNTTCVICLEDFCEDEKKSKVTEFEGCDHVVHSKCFFEYANHKLTTTSTVGCPVCRHVVLNFTRLEASPPYIIVPPPPRRVDEALIRDDEHGHTIMQQRVIAVFIALVLGVNVFYLLN